MQLEKAHAEIMERVRKDRQRCAGSEMGYVTQYVLRFQELGYEAGLQVLNNKVRDLTGKLRESVGEAQGLKRELSRAQAKVAKLETASKVSDRTKGQWRKLAEAREELAKAQAVSAEVAGRELEKAREAAKPPSQAACRARKRRRGRDLSFRPPPPPNLYTGERRCP